MAFINDNKHNAMYNNSSCLLNQFFHSVYKQEMNLEPAASWRLLKEYGGHLSIEEFRSNFKKVTYLEHYIIENIPQTKSIGVVFEKKITF